MSSVGGESVASRISEQKQKRHEFERQLEVLRNRINLLRVEESRSAKKTREIEAKTTEVVQARERHAKDLALRLEQQQLKVKDKAEVKERVQRIKNERKSRFSDFQHGTRQEKAQLYAQVKSNEDQALVLKAEIAELEKARGAALKQKLKAEAEAMKARREAEKMARLLEARKRTEEKLKQEEEETRKMEMVLSQLAEEERELMDRVKESQKSENSAYVKFEQLLLSPSLADFSPQPTPSVTAKSSPPPTASIPEPSPESKSSKRQKPTSRTPLKQSSGRTTYVTATGRVIELEDPLLELAEELNTRN